MSANKMRWLPAVSITVQPRQPGPDSSAEPCPALHVIAGSGGTIPRHQPGPDGRCRFCHTTTTTTKETQHEQR